MKRYLCLYVLFCVHFVQGQEISRKEFQKIVDETWKAIHYINKSEYATVESILQLGAMNDNKETFKSMTKDPELYEVSGAYTKAFVFPYYEMTNQPNEFRVNIFAEKGLKEKNNGEKFSRARYLFVLTAIVTYDLDKGSVVYKEHQLLTGEKDIHRWWLSQFHQHPNYNEKTKIIYDKFGFVPPPPPAPPENLNNTND
ncbi:hypothetical protein [Sinomicrobium weinanense]|uniref:Uncharacterized protein n=1 Tax=Sinomicrobium weinanense TaxID=2842200 RepID=A0A926JPS7_9FLAO|nr:hypothetical protein [Sinomicrobium weinanense]MBC9795225.1 hypothetical protein [Sinomicrobium weinanense]MBU3122002.1 hypothetical protein [Sinomicrobium weinanense]